MAKKPRPLSQTFNRAIANAVAAGKNELDAAATAHGVRIKSTHGICGFTGSAMVMHAPIAGAEKYKDADFASGVPIMLLLVRATKRGDTSDGSYLVTAQFKPGATAGQATFTDSAGNVVAERELLIQKRERMEQLFPGVYDGAAEIPVITSDHIHLNNKWWVDCYGPGWGPVILLFEATK
jgi:hypothetical protein